jgi:hypothetical protein
MDFTLQKYKELLVALQGYGEVTLRHDVDKKPQNSLATAQIEHELGWKATYYFRAVPESWDEEMIRKISAMGHEIGYHYESLATCDGDMEAAYQDFCRNLEKLRALVPVSTICMHGSPKSKWDSRDLWKHYDYHQLGITTEPYLDMDFSEVFYLTDTGRRWDGYKVSVRDKIPDFQEQWERKGWVYHSTDDVIQAIRRGTFPNRWTEDPWQWCYERGLQWMKNIVKALVIKKKL